MLASCHFLALLAAHRPRLRDIENQAEANRQKMGAMADHGRPPTHTPREAPCSLWARSLDPSVWCVGAFVWQVVMVITRRLVGALGTMAGSRVLESEDDEGSGTRRVVSDVRSSRPVDKHWRSIRCTGNHARGNGPSPGWYWGWPCRQGRRWQVEMRR